jgi:hypothetical protein
MRYDKVRFLSGYEGEGYQEIDNGTMLRLTDLNGNTVDGRLELSYTVIAPETETPAWGTP